MLFNAGEITRQLDDIVNSILEEVARWVNMGSGWVIDRIMSVCLDIARYQPIRGGTYVPLPQKLRNKQAILNIKNNDNVCDGLYELRYSLLPT